MTQTGYGSSPLARGTLEGDGDSALERRFIPARAGNTSAPSPTLWRRSVHPRSRGEHARRVRRSQEEIGSSPLARGTHLQALSVRTEGRFIPARAGNTRARAPIPNRRTVHPRSRGEHLLMVTRGLPETGSSPLARGTRDCLRC